MLAALASACCWAQADRDCQPAPSNAGGALYPCIHCDLRVTFRIAAPDAHKVLVSTNNSGSGIGKGPVELVRDKDGMWSVTVGPVVPGFHYYWYVVDGVEVSDPSSESYFGHNKELSGVEVPEKGTDFYDVRNVPHGDVRIHWYHSTTTGSWRRAYVYTPPDYDRNAGAGTAELWRFDRIDEIGGHKTTVLGHPRVIDSPVGKAVEFNGVDDALFVDVHPLAGAETFTWEIVFRPDPGGAPEQRFFHLQEQDARTGGDTATRMLSEIRVIDGRWCLDSFAQAGGQSRALLNRERLHPLGVWHRVAMVYDGHELRNYVDGVLEGSGELHLIPQGPGHSSIGVRINKMNYFKGAVSLARMTRTALSPAEFLK